MHAYPTPVPITPLNLFTHSRYWPALHSIMAILALTIIIMTAFVLYNDFHVYRFIKTIKDKIEQGNLTSLDTVIDAAPFNVLKHYFHLSVDQESDLYATAQSFKIDNVLKDKLTKEEQENLKVSRKTNSLFKRSLGQAYVDNELVDLASKMTDELLNKVKVTNIFCFVALFTTIALEITALAPISAGTYIWAVANTIALIFTFAFACHTSSQVEDIFIKDIDQFIESHSRAYSEDRELMTELSQPQYNQVKSIIDKYLEGHHKAFRVLNNTKNDSSLLEKEIAPRLGNIFNHLSIVDGMSLVIANSLFESGYDQTHKREDEMVSGLANDFMSSLTEDKFLDDLTLVATELNDKNLLSAMAVKSNKSQDIQDVTDHIIATLDEFDSRIIKTMKYGITLGNQVKSDIKTYLLAQGNTDLMDFDTIGKYYKLLDEQRAKNNSSDKDESEE